MRLNRTILALTLAASLLPLGVSAQQRGTTRVVTIAKHGFLGISYDFTSTSRDGKVTSSLSVVDVVKDSPADRAGLKPGDQILRIDGRSVSEARFPELVGQLQPGDAIRLRIASNGNERDVTLVAADRQPGMMSITLNGDSIRTMARIYLDSARAGMFRLDTLLASDSIFGGHFPDVRVFGRMRADGAFPFDTMFFGKGDGWRIFADSLPRVFSWRGAPPPDWEPFEQMMPRFEMMADRGVAGAEFTPITEGLGEYFGTDKGILVVRVGPDTPAARAGLLAGDVVTRIDGKAVSEVSELRRAVQRAGTEVLKLDVLRKGKNRSLELQARPRR